MRDVHPLTIATHDNITRVKTSIDSGGLDVCGSSGSIKDRDEAKPVRHVSKWLGRGRKRPLCADKKNQRAEKNG